MAHHSASGSKRKLRHEMAHFSGDLESSVDMNAVINLEEDETANTSTSSTATTTNVNPKPMEVFGMFCLFNIIESLNLLGFKAFDGLELLIEELCKDSTIMSDPLMIKLLTYLKKFLNEVFTTISLACLNQEGVLRFKIEEKTLDDLSDIFKPLMDKKEFTDPIFTSQTVQTFFTHVRRMDESSKNKKRKINEDRDLDTNVEHDFDEDFSDLFGGERRTNYKVKISQFLQINTSEDRKKIETTGEEGQYLIKIEMTDTKDLKTMDPKNYWKKCAKKAYFVLSPKNSELDSEMFESIMTVLKRVGKKLVETPGVRQSIVSQTKN